MRVVFLDFDGVLNSNRYLNQNPPSRNPYGGSGGAPSFHFSEDRIDPEAIQRLNTLVGTTGAHVVISSTWRTMFDLDQIRTMLANRGFRYPGKVIGTTPDLVDSRGEEIQAWLDQHQEAVRIGEPELESFVILDDDSDMGDLRANFVNTNARFGLSDDDVQRAIRILKMG